MPPLYRIASEVGGTAVHAAASDLYTAATLETDTIIQDG